MFLSVYQLFFRLTVLGLIFRVSGLLFHVLNNPKDLNFEAIKTQKHIHSRLFLWVVFLWCWGDLIKLINLQLWLGVVTRTTSSSHWGLVLARSRLGRLQKAQLVVLTTVTGKLPGWVPPLPTAAGVTVACQQTCHWNLGSLLYHTSGCYITSWQWKCYISVIYII